jgi:hypothetical protein
MGNAALCALSVQSSAPISNEKEKTHGFELKRKKGPRDRFVIRPRRGNSEDARLGRSCGSRSRPRQRAGRCNRKAISDAGGRADRTLGDLTTDAGADRVCGDALANGPVDILANNAGYYGSRGWLDTPEDE